MSAGHIHTRASLLLTGAFIFTGIATHNPITVLHALGSLIGVMIQPDNDVDAGTIHNRYIRKRIGWVAEMAWDGIWWMYRRSLKHGGELSHFPIISTIGRLAYLYFMLIVIPHTIIWIIFSPAWNIGYVLGWYWDRLWGQWEIILGLMGSDLIHFSLDILTTEHKHKQK